MAFCNACGATLDSEAKFCNRCGGAAVAAAAAPPSVQFTTPDTSRPGKGPVKIILTVVLAVLGVGFIGMAVAGFVRVLRIVSQTHVHHEGDKVKIESPLGTIESMADPEQVAHELGISIYPGAQAVKNGTATATFGDVHSTALNFVSSDSVETVANFYKSELQNATVKTNDSDHYTIVSKNSTRLITIVIQSKGGRTNILISHVTRRVHTATPASN